MIQNKELRNHLIVGVIFWMGSALASALMYHLGSVELSILFGIMSLSLLIIHLEKKTRVLLLEELQK